MLFRKNYEISNKVLIATILLCLVFAAFFALLNTDKNNKIDAAGAEVWNGETANAFALGDGASANTAYQISDAAELAYLASLINNKNSSYISAYYKLTADIVLNDTDDYAIWGTAFAPVHKWIPIGSSSSPFGGTFDGNGFSIKGMYINRVNEDYQGLFGYSAGVIKNVVITESYVAGKTFVGGAVGWSEHTVENCVNKSTVYAAANNCGGIAGYASGDIAYCSNLGSVSGGGYYIGGVLGQLKNASSVLNNCYNNGTVSGTGAGVGGVVGYNENGKIVNAANSGSVTGSAKYIGGIAGRSNGAVSNTYNTGSVAGTGASGENCNAIGGIIGYNESGGALSGLYNSYNIGAVTKPTENAAQTIGGAIGENGNKAVNSYAQRNSASDLALIGGGTGTAADIRSFSSSGQFKYNGENPNSAKINGAGVDYTTLQTALSAWVNANSASSPAYQKWLAYSTKMPVISPWSGELAAGYTNGGDGTEDNPFKIATAEQFAFFASQINAGVNSGKYFKLTNNIKLNNVMFLKDWVNYSLSASEYILNEWTPIGNEEKPFSGNFNGDGYTIGGIYVSNANSAYSGLFGYSTGVIKNVTLVNSFVLGGQYSAGIVGFNAGTVGGCSSSATVLADTSSGGIAGKNTGVIRNSVNKGNITGVSTADNIGGIAGNNYGASASAVIENCCNHGVISSSVLNICVGGIAGQSYGSYAKIQNTYNTGEIVAGGNKFGAIAGYSNNSDIFYSYYLKNSAPKCVGTSATLKMPSACSSFDEKSALTSPVTISGAAASSLRQALVNWVSKNNAGQGIYLGWNGTAVLPALMLDKKSVAHEISGMPRPIVWSGEAATAFAGGSGTEADPYRISTAEQLKLLSDLVCAGNANYNCAHYILTKNISLNNSASYINWTANVGPAHSWTPIGSEEKPFGGSFDGNGYTVNGLYISDSGTYRGLFGKNTGAVLNLSVTQSFISAASEIGFIAGANEGKIENAKVYGNIKTSGGNAGGLVGLNSGTVESSYMKGNVGAIAAAALNVGGIVGNNQTGGLLLTLNNSAGISVSVTGASSKDINVGGIAGLNAGLIANGYNAGNITISENPNSGSIKYRVGGIAGYNEERVTNSLNLGTAKSLCGYTELGGIVGLNNKTLANCVNIPDTHSIISIFSNGGRIEGGDQNAKTGTACYYQLDKNNEDKFCLWLSDGKTKITASEVSAKLNEWAVAANNGEPATPLKYYFWSVFSGAKIPSMTRVTVSSVTFNLNGGAFKTGFSAPAVYFQGVSNNALPVRNNVEKSESALKGWHLKSDLSDAVITDFSAAYKGDLVFYAEWTSELTEVAFDKQEGSGGTDKVTATNGLPMPTAENGLAVTKPSKEGYTFKGYFSETDGGGTKYYSDTMQSVNNWDKSGVETFTLYAFWKLNIYTLNFKDGPGFSIECPYTATHLEPVNLSVTVKENYRQSVPKITIDGGAGYIENCGAENYVYNFVIPGEKVTKALDIAVGEVSLDKFYVTMPSEAERIDKDNNNATMFSVKYAEYAEYHSGYIFTVEFLGAYFYFADSPAVTIKGTSGTPYSFSGARKVIDGETSDTTWKYSIAAGVIEENFSVAISGMSVHTHTFESGKEYICGTHTCIVCGRTVTLNGAHTPGDPATCAEPQKCTACGKVIKNALGHKYTDDYTCHDRTCLREGCGHVEEHTTVHIPGAPSDCTHDQICAVCGDIIVLASGHVMVIGTAPEDIVPPTCTEKGYTVWHCTNENCGYTEHRDFIDELGHDPGAAATCTKPQKCAVCGVELKEALGHLYADDHTCHDRTCIRPGCIDYYDYNPETHEYDIPVPHTEYGTNKHTPGPDATCTAPQKCIDCGKVLKDALGHLYADGHTCHDRTCTREGCGHIEEHTTGHIPGAPPDCTHEQICTVCGEILKPKLEHDWINTELLAATCVSDGYIEYTCNNCKETKREILPALGHSPGAPPDCTHDQICIVCGTVLAPARGHSFGDKVTVSPTCTEKGYDMRVCKKCGEIEKINFTEMLSHEWKKTGELAATCLIDGYIEYTCSHCGEKRSEIVPALGHAPGAPADCTHGQICTRCGEIIEKAHGHDWREATYDSPKTCKKCGITEGYPLTKITDKDGKQKADLSGKNNQKQAEILVRDINKNMELTVSFAGADLIIDSASLSGIATGSAFTVEAGIIDITALNEAEKRIVNGIGTVYDLTIKVDDSKIANLGGNITVILPYLLKENENGNFVKVWYLNTEKGSLEEVPCVYNKDTGTVSFKVSHLSKYMVGYVPPSEAKGGLSVGVIIGLACVIAAVIAVIVIIAVKKKKSAKPQRKEIKPAPKTAPQETPVTTPKTLPPENKSSSPQRRDIASSGIVEMKKRP